MTYRTHREFAISFALITNILVSEMSLSNTGYYVNLLVMLLAAKQGALFPDLDHDWSNVKEKSVINKVINSIIHLTGGKHRSWQTHSWDMWLVSLIGALKLNTLLSRDNSDVFILLVLGFWSGWFSHLVSDMLTSAGVRIFCWWKKSTVALVPKQANMIKNIIISLIILILPFVLNYFSVLKKESIIFIVLVALGLSCMLLSLMLKNMKFKTGDIWEKIVYKITIRINVVFTIIALCYPYIGSIMGRIKIWMV